MNNTFFIDFDKLRPTQFYLSKRNLDEVKNHFTKHSLEDYPPLPVINLGTQMLLVGRHHYAYYLYKKGKQIAEVYIADDYEFISVLKNYNDCIKKNIFNIKDLQKRILSNTKYQEKWITSQIKSKIKIQKNPLYNFRTNIVCDAQIKSNIIRRILNPIPSYFENEFNFENYIKNTKDMHFLSFELHGQVVAFCALKNLYDNAVEIYILGVHKKMLSTAISSKILNSIKKYTRSINRQYISVKVPIKTAVNNDISMLYDFCLKQGFAHVANLQSPWDKKDNCMLFIMR